MALWSGRFEEGVSEFTQRFGASLPVDKEMYREDIAGSIAHSKMLAAQGVISDADQQDIQAGLVQIRQDIDNGDFIWDINNEDIHMSVESVLTARIGDAGARLHTGRSRNDQVATDTRLFAKKRCVDLMEANIRLREALIAQAEANFDVIMPGYTHMQHAQPVLFSHHILAYTWMLARDFQRLQMAASAADANPLGSAALAGTTYPLDRHMTTRRIPTLPSSFVESRAVLSVIWCSFWSPLNPCLLLITRTFRRIRKALLMPPVRWKIVTRAPLA